MKAYCISGLGADQRVFQYLELPYELVALEWIKPHKKETLKAYAKRLAEGIPTREPFILIGVSFGGMIAVEIAKILSPVNTILISTVEVASELPSWYCWIGKLGIVNYLPAFFFRLPMSLAHWLFGTQHPLLKDILRDSDPAFTKWAITALTTWDNQEQLGTRFRIGGSKDRLLPPQQVDYCVEGGHHFMIVDRAEEVNYLINNTILRK